MATTREEVAIRLGIDDKAMKMGLDSAHCYLDKWRGKEKQSEKEYTNFWKQELEKRDRHEVELATRRNRARALWRERAAKREAAGELRLAQLAEQNKSALVERSGKALAQKAISLLKTNVYLAIFDLIRSAIPTVEEFWNKAYGVDEESQNKRKTAEANIASLRAAAVSSRDSLAKQRKDQSFASQSPLGQEALLEVDL